MPPVFVSATPMISLPGVRFGFCNRPEEFVMRLRFHFLEIGGFMLLYYVEQHNWFRRDFRSLQWCSRIKTQFPIGWLDLV
jgi:hypothetical protein